MTKSISDTQLLQTTKTLVHQERITLEKILEHLQEVQRRRLYADLGYSSLFKYLVRELKYSEGAAMRRIHALKLVKKVPEVNKMIAKGELSLSVACEAQSFTKNKTSQETKKVLNLIKNKTRDQAKKKLMEVSAVPKKIKREVIKRESAKTLRVSISLNEETMQKLKRLKGIKRLDTQEAIDHALDLAIKNYEDSLSKHRKTKNTKAKSRYITAAVKKQVVMRAKQTCEHPGCDETSYLEFEHTIPFSKGGNNTPDNIKLYCKTHNQRAAIKVFGQQTMDHYLKT